MLFSNLNIISFDVTTSRGQTVHFVNCKRIPQPAKIRFQTKIVESAKILKEYETVYRIHEQIYKI